MVSAATTELCPCSVEAATGDILMNEKGCIPKNFTKNRQWVDLAPGPQFSKP